MDFNQIKRLLYHSFKCQLDKNIPDHKKIITYLRASVGVGKTTVSTVAKSSPLNKEK